MKQVILLGIMLYASIAMAEDKGPKNDVRTFKPDQETIKVMDHVFELLK